MVILMGPFRAGFQYIRFISITAAAVLMLTTAAAAATRTWDGGGADNNWQTLANWEDDIAPAAGDDLVFPASVADKNTNNDFPADTEFTSITFDGPGYAVTGNRIAIASTIARAGDGATTLSCDITLKGGAGGGPFDVIVSVGSGALIVNGVIGGSDAVPATLVKDGNGTLILEGANTFAGPMTVTHGGVHAKHAQAFGAAAEGTTIVDGSVQLQADIAAEPLLLKATSTNPSALSCQTPSVCVWGGPIHLTDFSSFFYVNGPRVLRLSGAISGEGSLIASGTGTVELGPSNSYAGSTSANATLRLTSHDQLPASTTVIVSGTFDLNGFSQSIAGLTGSSGGETKIGAATLTLDVPAGAVSNYGSMSSGAGALIKKGEGLQYLGNTQAFTGVTTIRAGTLVLQGSMQGPVVLQNGAFRGIGTVKTLTAAGGRLDVGVYTEPGENTGLLYTTDALTLGSAVTLGIDINGQYVIDGYDQLRPTGQVTLGNATLDLFVNPDLTDIVLPMIIDNRSSTPVDGTFAGLPEGALVTSNGKSFTITYVGGDGNDVVLLPAAYEYFLSEGATGAFFDLDILIANPNAAAVNVRLTFLLPDGTTVVEQRAVAARSRLTVRVDDIAAVSDTAISTIVTSLDNLPLIVERTMRWGTNGYGAHTEQAVSGVARNWYFAEGAQGFFSTYLLLANPQDAANVATVTYLRENASSIVRTYPLAPKSRFTVDAGADEELVGRSFGMRVTFDQPGVAERSMYFGADPLWTAGHESAGVNAPANQWFLAEGATGSFFETFILMANPTEDESEVTVTFMPSTGAPIEKHLKLPAFERRTINVEAEDPALANVAVATKVSATNPIVVERAQYWPDPAPQWYEAHNSFGVTEAGRRWGLAEGRVGGPEAYRTYILIANPYSDAANVTITFLRENGAPFDKTFTVEPYSRFNVDIGPGTLVPELSNESFGAIVTSDVDVAVERAMYSNANGQIWAAGTNATAAPLP